MRMSNGPLSVRVPSFILTLQTITRTYSNENLLCFVLYKVGSTSLSCFFPWGRNDYLQ